jgi:hypothetical protein
MFDNICVIKTGVDQYLREIRDEIIGVLWILTKHLK